jgi:predicted PurR-regulated permease PerM
MLENMRIGPRLIAAFMVLVLISIAIGAVGLYGAGKIDQKAEEAVTQLSQTTQQNASSSEELAATAEEMSGQAEQLQQTVAFFRVQGAMTTKPRVKTVVADKAPTRRSAPASVGNLALAASDPDLGSFAKF